MPAPLPTGPLVTRASLACDLRALGVRSGETLLAHSSLSSLGWVNGGRVAVVQALLDVLGEDGTLVVPAESGDLSDPAHWIDPPVPEQWWETVRATMPAYDPRTTPTRSIGVIPETVRTWPGALRSAHPLTSFAALGPRAAEIVEGHAADCRLGDRSPLGRLEERGARVLMLGTAYGACTGFHLAEYRVPHAFEDAGRPGPAGWEHVTEVAISADRFDELGAAFERDAPVVPGRVGAAQSRLFPLADAVAYAQSWLPVHRPCLQGRSGAGRPGHPGAVARP
ncbi:AAC(3) family N-acetyltransferase [Streptomyces kunmingensis]|uniref:AAC(3) family N-acetyltransferase n=1 Tax=Streptomyces kunmingensis TaxID=68225 RepID=A0ABU6CQX7_9ACTN|nr:AAC(3) family N-acetyltransferase [Streptomyces kunmingensis]MEB3966331.1 AAC(3) family N-acetyltransferase [Streptomyces kunmingensis]